MYLLQLFTNHGLGLRSIKSSLPLITLRHLSAVPPATTTTIKNPTSCKRVTITDLRKKYEDKMPIVMTTTYDRATARFAECAEMDIALVGDSVGMVVLGYDSTTPVTMEDMVRHTAAVSRSFAGTHRPFLLGDMPFASYLTVEDAVRNAARLMKEGGADAVKLEGGRRVAPMIRAVVECGIPVMGHIGLTPQTASAQGGFKVQANRAAGAAGLLADALALQDVGCFSICLEAVPARIAGHITELLNIPTIGIGAGPQTSGQVQVFHDMVGMYDKLAPKFAKPYTNVSEAIVNALKQYKTEVTNRSFPGPEHSFTIKEDEFQKYLELSSTVLGMSNSSKCVVKTQKATYSTFRGLSLCPSPKKVSQFGCNKIKVAIIGGGAMGTLYSKLLYESTHRHSIPISFTMVTSWVDHVDRIRLQGLSSISKDGTSLISGGMIDTLLVSKDRILPNHEGAFDLCLILVKSSATREASRLARSLLRPQSGIIITLQNGFGNYEIIQSELSTLRQFAPLILRGMSTFAARIHGPGVIEMTGHGKTVIENLECALEQKSSFLKFETGASYSNDRFKPIIFDEEDNVAFLQPEPSAETGNKIESYEDLAIASETDASRRRQVQVYQAFIEALRYSNLNPCIPSTSSELFHMLWTKLALNAIINPLTALFNVKNGQLRKMLELEEGIGLAQRVITEVSNLAKAENQVDLNSAKLETELDSILRNTEQNVSSMLSDIQRKAVTEINSINGYVVSRSSRNGLEAPTNAALWSLILMKQSDNHLLSSSSDQGTSSPFRPNSLSSSWLRPPLASSASPGNFNTNNLKISRRCYSAASISHGHDMKIFSSIADYRNFKASCDPTLRIGFCPTMGALHAGHMSLMKRAKLENNLSVASIFVNPKQFAAHEDLSTYPRPIEKDIEMLRSAGVDVLFLPTPEIMYPKGFSSLITMGPEMQGLEGGDRPHFFSGVATVCLKLFNIVGPTISYFGQKDAQQCAVIRKMATDFNLPMQISVVATLREADGLAMSSRNMYLSPSHRTIAPYLFKSLLVAQLLIEKSFHLPSYSLTPRSADNNIHDSVIRSFAQDPHCKTLLAGIDSTSPITSSISTQTIASYVGQYLRNLSLPDFALSYVHVSSTFSMAPLDHINRSSLQGSEMGICISIAAKLGHTRLIDNIVLHLP